MARSQEHGVLVVELASVAEAAANAFALVAVHVALLAFAPQGLVPRVVVVQVWPVALVVVAVELLDVL